jgi:hypothetical protein
MATLISFEQAKYSKNTNERRNKRHPFGINYNIKNKQKTPYK